MAKQNDVTVRVLVEVEDSDGGLSRHLDEWYRNDLDTANLEAISIKRAIVDTVAEWAKAKAGE